MNVIGEVCGFSQPFNHLWINLSWTRLRNFPRIYGNWKYIKVTNGSGSLVTIANMMRRWKSHRNSVQHPIVCHLSVCLYVRLFSFPFEDTKKPFLCFPKHFTKISEKRRKDEEEVSVFDVWRRANRRDILVREWKMWAAHKAVEWVETK